MMGATLHPFKRRGPPTQHFLNSQGTDSQPWGFPSGWSQLSDEGFQQRGNNSENWSPLAAEVGPSAPSCEFQIQDRSDNRKTPSCSSLKWNLGGIQGWGRENLHPPTPKYELRGQPATSLQETNTRKQTRNTKHGPNSQIQDLPQEPEKHI